MIGPRTTEDHMPDPELKLPTDIPWKRKCVSPDMMDRNICDAKGPYRWRSSIAVFEYEPEDENQTYDGARITYLKVSCSITGYQENFKEIGLDRRGVNSHWHDQPGIANYLDLLEKYYPCYGAVLEVAVAPENERDTALEDYPYLLDFGPKKRELYEQVTNTGETMSRSLEDVKLGKSNTSVRTHEVLDVDKGWEAAANVEAKGVEVGLSGGREGEWGTKDVTQETIQNQKNLDASQERRETQSHSTQLTQMYHQLDSYHLGTNRSVFFIHPRPHVVENERTFVNGPRNIEGMQDFFFVVLRPQSVERLCVSAYLETGHIGKVPRTVLEEVPGTEMQTVWKDQFHAQPKGNDDETTVYDDKDRIWDVNSHYPGYKIKSAVITAGPPTIRYNYGKPNLIDVHPHIAQQNDDYVKISGKVHSGFKNYVVDADRWEEITYPFSVDLVLVKKQIAEKTDDTLFLTGRRLCCCNGFIGMDLSEGIVYERKLDVDLVDEQRGIGPGMSIRVANQKTAQIRAAVVRSRHDDVHRHAKPVRLAHADFTVRSAARYLGRGSEKTIDTYENLPSRIRDRFTDLNVTLGEVLDMPARMVEDVFNLPAEDVIELRDTLLGIANTEYDYRKAWLTSAQVDRLFAKGTQKPRR
jgi:hypothetical protein